MKKIIIKQTNGSKKENFKENTYQANPKIKKKLIFILLVWRGEEDGSLNVYASIMGPTIYYTECF